jgi:hypothetical protein
VQGTGGRWYFSYVPITETHTDPDGNQYDTIHVEFPYTEEEHIPKRGKVSVIAECCEFPEPIVKKEDPNAKKDKKKKEEAEVWRRLDPIPEPVQYTTFQLVGRIGLKSKHTSNASMSLSDTQTQSLRGPGHKAPPVEEEGEDFEYVIATKQGHILKLGARHANPRAIKYLEMECPLPEPRNRNFMEFGCRRACFEEKADRASGSLFGGPDRRMSQPANAYKATRKRRPRPVANHQMCIFCRTLARPNVVMDQKKDIRVVNPPKKFYTNWEGAMLKKLKYTGGSCSLVILELGCEKKLDATRKLSERVYKLTKNSQRSTHIRISADDISVKKGAFGESEKVITIVDNVLNALLHIDRCMMDMKRRK